MTQRPPQPPWIPYLGIIVMVAGSIYTAGNISGDVKRNTDRIGVLEANDRARSDGVMAIDRRTTRIEAKLDYLLPKDAGRDAVGGQP